MCLNTVGGRVDSMPYGRPIIRSLSQNYHEAEVKYFFSPIFLSNREVAKIIDKRPRLKFFSSRTGMSCSPARWKPSARTWSSGSKATAPSLPEASWWVDKVNRMDGACYKTWSNLVINGHTSSNLVIWKQGDRTISAGSIMVSGRIESFKKKQPNQKVEKRSFGFSCINVLSSHFQHLQHQIHHCDCQQHHQHKQHQQDVISATSPTS